MAHLTNKQWERVGLLLHDLLEVTPESGQQVRMRLQRLTDAERSGMEQYVRDLATKLSIDAVDLWSRLQEFMPVSQGEQLRRLVDLDLEALDLAERLSG